ncbi:hypothetical protein [Streptomyces sp. SID8499]|uniref:hypothetical protein n=1 Tax=Streptomyces sp. SID8499 TaxID=2706106 RepID=UPI001941015F|nr:hypothetical protein [Streptomyces sp. SID8499]
MSQYPSLTRALAETLVDLAWFIESADDDHLDQDDAVKALEGVAAVVDRLSDSQRGEFQQLIEVMTAAETDTGRREHLDPVDVTLDDARTPGQGQPGGDRSKVSFQAVGEDVETRQAADADRLAVAGRAGARLADVCVQSAGCVGGSGP